MAASGADLASFQETKRQPIETCLIFYCNIYHCAFEIVLVPPGLQIAVPILDWLGVKVHIAFFIKQKLPLE